MDSVGEYVLCAVFILQVVVSVIGLITACRILRKPKRIRSSAVFLIQVELSGCLHGLAGLTKTAAGLAGNTDAVLCKVAISVTLMSLMMYLCNSLLIALELYLSIKHLAPGSFMSNKTVTIVSVAVSATCFAIGFVGLAFTRADVQLSDRVCRVATLYKRPGFYDFVFALGCALVISWVAVHILSTKAIKGRQGPSAPPTTQPGQNATILKNRQRALNTMLITLLIISAGWGCNIGLGGADIGADV